jgi:prepilin-type processing-associated H-X9-DG protein
MYFNPRHGGKSPAVRADGSVKLYGPEYTTYPSGFLYSPNSVGNPSRDPRVKFAVETWGNYLHPSYAY